MPCGKKKGKGKGGRSKMFALTAFTMAFLRYEIPGKNMTKICVYESYKGQHTVVVKSWQMCQRSIKVD
jgi:hypothetical protein